MATMPRITLLLLSLLAIAPPPWSNFAYAQNNSGGSSYAAPPPPYFNPRFNPSMAILIVILITAFFFMGFFSIYLRNCGSSASDGGSGTGRIPIGAVGSAARSRRAGNRGLDPAVIATFPRLVYSDVKEHRLGKSILECAVCLSEFDDDGDLRLLPNCSHAFHTDCIDTWLASHTTCPVCRDNLAAHVPGAAASAEGADATAAATDGAATASHEEPAAPPSAAADGSVGSRSRSRRDQEHPKDHVVVDIPAPRAPADETMTAPLSSHLSASGSMKRSGSTRGGFGGIVRGGSMRIGPGAGSLLRSWRSRSARPTLWAEEDRERFTLRLPEYVRREVMSGKLNRSRSLASFPIAAPPMAATATAVDTSESGSRRGYRGGAAGEGSSRGGGWSARFGWAAKSDRWASRAQQLSSRFGLGGNGNGGGDAAEGSTVPGKAEAGEGSVSSRGKTGGNGEKKGVGGGRTGGGGYGSTLPFGGV